MLETLELLPPDPILGVSKAYKADPRGDKIDLGVGVYKIADGTTPVMAAVKEAETLFLKQETTKSYTPPAGFPGFTEAITALLLGADHPALALGRVSAVQAPGGCGALRLAAEVLVRRGSKRLIVGAPTWANHVPLISSAGLKVEMVPLYDQATSSLTFDAFADHLHTLGPEDTVLLHGACHNPTGADFSAEQWQTVLEITLERGFLPFIDTAYHGFAQGLEADAAPIRMFADQVPEMLVSYSCSKNFGLYRERTGALIVLGRTPENAEAVKSHMANIARTMYSMPPAHGGALVTTILHSDELKAAWHSELAQMQADIASKRDLLVKRAEAIGMGNGLSFIRQQHGMFSLLPLSSDQVVAMREDHGIYMPPDGRINMCGLMETNVDKFCQSFRSVQ